MTRSPLRPTLVCLVASVAACAGESPGRDPFGGADGIVSADDDGEGDDDGDSGDPLDLGGDDDGGLEAVGCKSVDVLFVIDNSASMAEQQGRLLASFPGFIDAITSTIEDVDSYHIGVVTSDAYSHNSAECKGLGDLVTKTGGEDSSETYCGPMLDGRRYATEADDLEQVFPCIAKVGTDGDSVERPISAAVAALDPAKSAPGGCNEGFVRDDAILVLVVVTDDPPFAGDVDDAHPDGGDPDQWHDAVVAAKGGNADATVVIGFVPYDDVWCMTIEIESPNLIDFVEAFGDRGILQSVCSPDYGESFANTIATIHSTCEDFVPVG